MSATTTITIPPGKFGVHVTNDHPGGVVTAEPQHPMTSSGETTDAVAAQIREVRDVLRSDATAAGIDFERVDAAVDTALAAYTNARVHGFIGVLVERDVRSALCLRQGATPGS